MIELFYLSGATLGSGLSGSSAGDAGTFDIVPSQVSVFHGKLFIRDEARLQDVAGFLKAPQNAERCLQITSLTFGNMTPYCLSQEPVPAMRVILTKCPNIRSFGLDDTWDKTKPGAAIEILSGFPNVTELHLMGRAYYGGSEVESVYKRAWALAKILPKLSSIATLDLSEHAMRWDGQFKDGFVSKLGFRSLVGALENCRHITTLNLFGSTLGSEGAKVLAKACQNMKVLILDKNGIGSNGAIALVQALPRTMTTLSLSDNGIEVDGAIASALPHCPQLTTLNLKHNYIGRAGAIALADALPKCKALTTIDVGYNTIDDDGVKAIATALPLCPHLTHLKLRANTITHDGALALLGAVRTCFSQEARPTLAYIDIRAKPNSSYPFVSDVAAAEIASVNRTLPIDFLASGRRGCPSQPYLDRVAETYEEREERARQLSGPTDLGTGLNAVLASLIWSHVPTLQIDADDVDVETLTYLEPHGSFLQAGHFDPEHPTAPKTPRNCAYWPVAYIPEAAESQPYISRSDGKR